MATTFADFTGDGNATKAFSFPSIKEADIKVEVDGTVYENRGITGASSGTTTFTITSYTTTGGGNVVFDSAPSSPAGIRIYRDTDVDAAKATFSAGASIKANDLNNNQTQLLYAAQEEQNQSVITSRIKDANVTTAKIKDANVTTAKIAADAITAAKIADDVVNSEHYAAGSIDTEHIADSQITTAKIADSNVTTVKIADNNVTADKLAHTSVTAGSYTAADITVDAQGRITAASSGAIATSEITNSAVTADKIATDAVITAKIQNTAVTTAKIANDAVTQPKIGAGAVDNTELATGAVSTVKIQDATITTAKLADGLVNTDKLGADAVTAAKLADNAVVTANIVNANVTTAKIADSAVTAAKIASNAVTTDKIADSELSTLAGMQSGTASKLADSTALTADIADLNQIDGMAKQTTITDDDTKFPTSGAVVDYVAAQLEPFGGFEAIANESSFPNTQPASGVVISIADAGGMSVSGSGTASGATVGGTTVNITGIASNFNGTTITNGVRFLVVSTGSGQNYTYHKATLREDDLATLSGDINDFAERYRVGASNPTTSLDNGDLFFNTGSGKLLVYNGTNSAWEETQTVGNFFINTISSSSGTGGGSATFNGSAYRFTLSNAGASAQQHIVSINGVVQKPNAGTSQPSEGFAIDGGDIIFSSAPPSGADYFIITVGASVSIGTPSNNTVTTAILQNGAVTTAKITDANVTTAKIADDAVTAAKLANTSVSAGSYGSATAIPAITVDAQGRITAASTNTVNTTTNLATTTATGSVTVTSSTGNNATISEATSSAAGVMSTAHHDKLDGIEASATADQTNSEIAAALSDQRPSMKGATFTDDGTSSPVVEIKPDDANPWGLIIGNATYSGNQRGIKILQEDGGHTKVRISGQGEYRLLNFEQDDGTSSRALMTLSEDGNVYLRHQGTIKFNTTNTGAKFSGQSGSHTDVTILGYEGYDANLNLYADEGDDNADRWRILSSTDGSFYLQNYTSGSWEWNLRATGNAGVDLYYNHSKKLETTDGGISVTNDISVPDNGVVRLGNIQGGDLKLYHDGTNSVINNKTGDFKIGASHAGNINIYTNNVERYQFTDGSIRPLANNTYDLGTSSLRWQNIYTNDLHLSNEGSSNDMDGSWGDWTIQEGESDLFLKNNRSGKKYKFNLTEVA